MTAEVASTARPRSGLPASLKPLLLLIGIAAAVAAGVTVVLWSRGPTYSLLYANLAAEDQAQVAQALDAAQIPYRMQPGSNAIEVPAERSSDARLKLAGQGLPEAAAASRMMDKDPGFGVSQFMENARYQHALETELARTIASLRPVEGARVHLAVPRQSAFVRDRTARALRCSCSSKRAGGSSRSRCRRSSTSSPPAFRTRSQPGHRGRPAGPAAVLARRARRVSPCASSSST